VPYHAPAPVTHQACCHQPQLFCQTVLVLHDLWTECVVCHCQPHMGQAACVTQWLQDFPHDLDPGPLAPGDIEFQSCLWTRQDPHNILFMCLFQRSDHHLQSFGELIPVLAHEYAGCCMGGVLASGLAACKCMFKLGYHCMHLTPSKQLAHIL
jgi:hypothetical protein